MKNSYTIYLKESKEKIEALKERAEKLDKLLNSKDIDFNEHIIKAREYNNLILKIEAEENLIHPERGKKQIINTYTMAKAQPTKRCC